MNEKLQAFSHIVEPAVTILSASTVRILLDRIQKKTMSLITVLFQYVSWTLVWCLVYTNMNAWNDQRLIYVSIATLLAWDIVRFVVSKLVAFFESDEFADILKQIVMMLITKK